MVKAAEPDRIPILSAAQLQQEFATLLAALSKDETEHTWEQIDKAIKRFHAVVRGGGAKSFPDEFVRTFKDKPVANGIIRSLITERTRLSGSTLDLIAACTRLGHHFQPLLHPFLPIILRLLCRTNKLYISRAAATIASIICHTHLSDVLKYIVSEWKAESGKSSSYREKAAEALGVALGVGASELMIDKEGFERRMEELEWIIKTGATDREAKVRGEIKKCWEVYKVTWPERVPQFTAPMTPVIRRYLNIGAAAPGGAAASSSSSAPARAPVKKPKVPSGLSSSVSAPPAKAASSALSASTSHKPAAPSLSASTSSRPPTTRTGLSASTSRAPTTTAVPPKEPLRNLAKSVGASGGLGLPSQHVSLEASRVTSGSTSSSRSASRNQESEERGETSDRSAPPSAAPTPATTSTYRSAPALKSSASTSSLSNSRSQTTMKPSESTSSLASSTSASRHAPPLPTQHGPFKPSASTLTRPALPPSMSSSSLGNEPRKARRVVAPAPPVPSLPPATIAPVAHFSRPTASSAVNLGASVGRKAHPAPSSSTSSRPFRPHPPAVSAAKTKAALASAPGRVAGAAPSATRGAKIPAAPAGRERARSPELLKKVPTPSATPSADTLAARDRREKKEAAVVAAAAVVEPIEVEPSKAAEEPTDADLERLVDIVEEGGQFASKDAEESVEGNVLEGLNASAEAEEPAEESQETVMGEVGMESTMVIEESQSQAAVVRVDPNEVQQPQESIVEEEIVEAHEQSVAEPIAESEQPIDDPVEQREEELTVEQEPLLTHQPAEESAAPSVMERSPSPAEAQRPPSPLQVDRSPSPVEVLAPAPIDDEDGPVAAFHEAEEGEEEKEEVVPLAEAVPEGQVLDASEESQTVVESEEGALEQGSDIEEAPVVKQGEQGLEEEEEGEREADDDISPRLPSGSSTPTRLSPTSPTTSFTPPPASPMFSNLPSTSTFAPAFSSPEPFAQTCSIVMETPPRWDPKVKGGIKLPGMRSVVADVPQEVEAQQEQEHEAERSKSPTPSSPITVVVERPTRSSSPSPSPAISPSLDNQRMQDVSAIFLPDDSLIGDDLEDSSFEGESFANELTREFDVPLNDASMLSSISDTPDTVSSRGSNLDSTLSDGHFVDESAPTVVISPSSRRQPQHRASQQSIAEDEEEPESSFELEMEDHARELVFHDETEDEVESAAEEEEGDRTADDSRSTINAGSPAREGSLTPEAEPEPEPVVLKRSLRSRVVTVELNADKKTLAPATRALTRSRGAGGAVLNEMQV